jgi:hypothetical protein
MYGLPQAGMLVCEQLVKHIAAHGYILCPHTPGVWTHVTRDIHLCLVVDDFGIKYIDCANADHLLAALEELGWYPIPRHDHVKLLTLPQPHLRTRTYTQTYPSRSTTN